MKKFYYHIFIILSSIICQPAFGQAKTLSPKEFLGYDLGDRFTRHHDMRMYYEHVASTNSNVKIVEYGKTNEHRPLFVAIITDPSNFENLEEIRKDNLKRTGLLAGNTSDNKTAVVWLSYNVHGNESSSLDASIKTIYELVNPDSPRNKAWLKNTVVIMDPCINPDGRERYVNHFYEKGNSILNPNGDSKEHIEPWPGGRANHYLFDLNRDWAWQTQIESQQRIALYNQWMPHVHVDFHEQGYSSPYYFAPAAKPYHEVITAWQREFQTIIGKNHAKYFDEQGWLYFTKEVFDLLYPSYGDTYPTYNGAIGMTYEQAGSGYAGIGIKTEFGDTLTLKDRLTHHFTTGLSTIEITSLHADKVVTEFEKYFQQNRNNPTGTYKSYVIKEGNTDKLEQLLNWLDSQKIQYGSPSSSASYKGFDYLNNRQSSFSVNSSDIVVSAFQPKGALVRAFFEPDTKVEDTLTYDITAWAVPYIYGLEAYATTSKINTNDYQKSKTSIQNKLDASTYAYAIRYKSFKDLEFLSELLQTGIKVRSSNKPFTADGISFDRGSIIITRRNNESNSNWNELVAEVANKHKRKVYELGSGFVEAGPDLGANSYHYIKPPKVALVGGDKTSSLSFGEVWHYFDKEIKYPITTIYTDYFNRIDLNKYDVLIVPEVSTSWFDEDMRNKLAKWTNDGGRLILIENAIDGVLDSNEFKITKYASEETKKSAEKQADEIKKIDQLASVESSERRSISNSIPGAIFKVHLDNSHPLAYGYGKEYYSLKANKTHVAYLPEEGNVGVIKHNSDLYSGFVGKNLRNSFEETLVFGVEQKGRGEVVYMVDNPLYRDFWQNGKLLFGNAVFLLD